MDRRIVNHGWTDMWYGGREVWPLSHGIEYRIGHVKSTQISLLIKMLLTSEATVFDRSSVLKQKVEYDAYRYSSLVLDLPQTPT